MSESGKMIKPTAKENSGIPMVTFMRDSGRMTKLMDMVSIQLVMDQAI